MIASMTYGMANNQYPLSFSWWLLGLVIIALPIAYEYLFRIYAKIKVKLICQSMLKDYHKLLKEQEQEQEKRKNE